MRESRARYGLAARQELTLRVKCSGAAAEALQACRDLVMQMATLSAMDVGADQERTTDSATALVGDAELFVPGVIDPEQEKARLQKQRDKIAKQLGGLEKKLDNPNFVAKAPADVVAKEQAAMAELKGQLEGIEAGLKALGG